MKYLGDMSNCVARRALICLALTAPCAVFAELPVPCAGGTCGGANWVGAGSATQSVRPLANAGEELRIQQLSKKALFNWESFDIGVKDKVSFDQPDASSLALNRVFQQSPSRILGSIEANGQVYLINRAGIIFGEQSQINVGTLMASSLEVPDIDKDGTVNEADYSEFLDRGLTSFFVNASGAIPHALENREAAYGPGADGVPLTDDDAVLPESFSATAGPDGQAFKRGAVWVQDGSRIKSADFGKVMLFGSEVTNAGVIETPRGQAVIAASKEKLWVEPSAELRGFVIELDHGGDVHNFGEIIAKEGNASLLGRVVRQNGTVRATTSVDFDGSIILRAEEVASITRPPQASTEADRIFDEYGQVAFGENSVTEVALDDSGATAVDAQVQKPSSITAIAERIDVERGARLTATGGNITLDTSAIGVDPEKSEINVAAGATFDVSGADVDLPMSRNIIEVQLFSNELKDAPLQRDGPLRGEVLQVDVRKGTPLADIAPALATIPKTVQEKASQGGSVSFNSTGKVTFADDILINLSGGEIHYDEGFIETSKLVTATGRVLDVSEARPDLLYAGLYGNFTRDSFKWGLIQQWTGGAGNFASFEPAYSDFQAGGVLAVSGSTISGLDVLDIITETRIGRYQQHTPPGAGTLAVGRKSTVNFQTSFGAPSVRLISSLSEQQRQDYESAGDVVITEDLVNRSGLSFVDIQSNGEIYIGHAGSSLNLPDFTRVGAKAKRINLAGEVYLPGGEFSATVVRPGPAFDQAPDLEAGIVLADGVSVDVSGRWFNDLSSVVSSQFRALPVHAGVIQLGADTSGVLVTQDTAKFSLNGGGWLDQSSTLLLGDAGSLVIDFGEDGSSVGAVNGQAEWRLDAFGGDGGGQLDITVPGLVVDAGAASGISLRDDSFVVDPSLFTDYGFESISLVSSAEDLLIPAGNYELSRRRFIAEPEDVMDLPDAASLAPALQPSIAFADDRTPLSLELAVAGQDIQDLILATGANIDVGTEGQLTLRNASEGQVLVDGSLVARGGQVDLLALSFSSQPYNPLRNLLWLGPNTRIDVSGTTIPVTDTSELPSARVLGGGTVNIDATGYVVAETGSTIDVSGTSTELTVRGVLPKGETVASGISKGPVSSDAGALFLSATEGLFIDSTFSARGGADESRHGQVQIDLKGDRALTPGSVIQFANPRHLTLVDDKPALDADFSSLDSASPIGRSFAGFADEDNGRGFVAMSQIKAGGFSRVGFAAQDLISFDTGPEIDSLEVSAGEYLSIEAPRLSTNSHVRLSAPRVQLSGFKANDNPLVEGDYRFDVTAESIDVLGFVGLDNVNHLKLTAAKDIRLGGIDGSYSGAGNLKVSNSAELVARQVYPLTRARFDLIAGAGATGDSVVSIIGNGSPTSSTLTAGGTLDISAGTVFVDGVLKAPFGQLKIEAEAIEVGKAGVLSVAADAPVAPFGYSLFDALPEDPAIALLGDSLSIDPGSRIDFSGGGELAGWLFVPGPGGSRDILDPINGANRFAIIPGVDTVPLSADEFSGDHLAVGKTVVIEDAQNGLPAGSYTLLPARYALLEGSWLLNLESDFVDIAPGLGATLLDGAALVSGRFSIAGSDAVAPRYTAFSLRPGADARVFSEYDEQLSSLFQEERSSIDNRLWRPADAARLEIVVKDALEIAGDIVGGAASGGREGLATISAEHVTIVNSLRNVGDKVELLASDLSRINVGTLLVGGSATRTSDGLAITAEAASVSVDSGVSLELPELLLTATESIDLGAATLRGTAEREDAVEISLDGAEAFAGLLGSTQVNVTRGASAPVPTSPQIIVDDGMTLASAGGIVLSALSDVNLSDATLEAGSVYLESANIALGRGAPAADGIRLNPARLANLAAAQSLTFKSANPIRVYNEAMISNPQLSVAFAGPGLINQGGDNLTVSASEVRFDNPDNILYEASILPAVLDAGEKPALAITADTIISGDNNFSIAGWESVATEADMLLATGDGSLEMIDANTAEFVLGGIATRPGATLALKTDADLQILNRPDVTAIEKTGLGGTFIARAASLTFDTNVWLPSGRVELSGANGLSIGPNALIDVAGVTTWFLDQTESTWGGSASFDSTHGDINFASGGAVDVGGGLAAERSGRVEFRASAGTVDIEGELVGGAADLPEHGASIYVDALRITSGDIADPFLTLNAALNAQGFSAQRIFRLRDGDLPISEDTLIKAHDIFIALDQGTMQVNGILDASGVDTDGGHIELFSRGDMLIGATAKLLADSTQADGGSIFAGTAEGWLSIGAGSAFNAGGGERSGEIHFRAPQNATQDDVQLRVVDVNGIETTFSNELIGAGLTRIEGFRSYDVADGVIDVTDLDTYKADTQGFIDSHAGTIAGRLGIDTSDNQFVVPGLLLTADEDLALNAALDFSGWLFDPDGDAVVDTLLPGHIVIRAPGDIAVNADMHSGVTESCSFFGCNLVAASTPSWTISATAGFATQAVSWRSTDNIGDFSVSDGVSVMTTTGDINIAAGGDVSFLGQLLTLGRPEGIEVPGGGFSPAVPLLENGGDVTVLAGGAIRGDGQQNQVPFFTDGLELTESATAPGISGLYFDPSAFSFDIGSLAGGNVDIHSGASIDSFSVGATTALLLDGNEVTARLGQANVTVVARDDFDSSYMMVGDGKGYLAVGGEVGIEFNYEGNALTPALSRFALQGGSVQIDATGAIKSGGAINPTLPRYLSYSGNSLFSARSLAGDVVLFGGDLPQLNYSFPTAGIAGGNQYLKLPRRYPGTVQVTAHSGGIESNLGLALAPSASGQLRLLAEGDIETTGGGLGVLTMSEIDPSTLPLDASVSPNLTTEIDIIGVLPPDSIHADNPRLSYLISNNGNLGTEDERFRVDLPMPAKLFAKGDVYNPEVKLKNIRRGDVSSLVAGGEITGISAEIQGPGRFDLAAKGGMDFLLMKGVTASGGLRDNRFAELGGADINVYVGALPDELNWSGFVEPYLDQIDDRERLLGEIKEFLASLSKTQATDRDTLMEFLGLPASDLAAFSSEAFRSDQEFEIMLTGLALDLEITAALARSNASDVLRNVFLTDEQLTSELVNAVRVFRKRSAIDLPEDTALQLFDVLSLRDKQLIVERAMLSLPETTQRELSRTVFSGLSESLQRELVLQGYFGQLRDAGRLANRVGPEAFDRGYRAIETLFPEVRYLGDLTLESDYSGDLIMGPNRIYTLDGGDINILIPGGSANAGLSKRSGISADQLGIVVQKEGDIRAMVHDSFAVNQSRVFTLGAGNIMMWASQGDLDAGRGAKTAISAPAPQVSFDQNGEIVIDFGAAISGSGIRQIDTGQEDFDFDVDPNKLKPRNGVDLVAPTGEVNAGEAGIGAAGDLNIAAARVVGTELIDVGGVAVGIPDDNSGAAASLVGVSNLAGNATSGVADEASSSLQDNAAERLAFLEVNVLDYGARSPAPAPTSRSSTKQPVETNSQDSEQRQSAD